MPLRALGFQHVKGTGESLFAGPAHRKLHDHDRQTQQHQKCQINQYKCAAAVLTDDIRKAPYIAEADGTPAEISKKPSRDENVSRFSKQKPLSLYHSSLIVAKEENRSMRDF